MNTRMNQGEFRITPAEQEIIELYVENNAKIVLNSYVDRSSAKRARFMNLKKRTQNIIDYFEFAKKECEEYSAMYQGFDAIVYAKSILQKLNGVESEIPINVTFNDHWKQLTQLRKEYVKNAATAKQKNEQREQFARNGVEKYDETAIRTMKESLLTRLAATPFQVRVQSTDLTLHISQAVTTIELEKLCELVTELERNVNDDQNERVKKNSQGIHDARESANDSELFADLEKIAKEQLNASG